MHSFCVFHTGPVRDVQLVYLSWTGCKCVRALSLCKSGLQIYESVPSRSQA